ncbi:hypothetical protein Tco_1355011 [Tanacetum coccineum]
MEVETEKEGSQGYLDIVPREEFAEDVESLSIKYPIVDWKTCVLTENFMYYQIFRGDGIKERYSASRPEGYDLMLWGDLHTLFEPDEEDEIWKNQHEYNLISWSLLWIFWWDVVFFLLMQIMGLLYICDIEEIPTKSRDYIKDLKKEIGG